MTLAPTYPLRRRLLGALGLVAWVAGLAATIAGLGALGHGALAAPPVDDPGTWSAWAAERGPVEAAFALLRLGVLAVAGYLLAATALSVVARLVGLGRLVATADALSGAAVRRVVHGALGAGLTATLVSGAGGGIAIAAEAPTAAAAGETDVMVPPGEGAVLRLLPEAPPTPSHDPAPPRVVPPGAARTWEVGPGDHLWSIAERTLAQAWGRPPADAEIAPYWRAVVDANRSALQDPDNPDLVYPKQVFVLPDPPPTAR